VNALRAQPIASRLHALLDESHVAVPERLEVGEDVDVDQMRRAELAHGEVHLLAFAAGLVRRERLAVELRLGVRFL
jgi:hypothetical protein